jgi:DNA end-binding protein Ku
VPRSIASLSISFGLVSIPVKLYSATESSEAIRFKWMAPSGARVRQQYVTEGQTSLRPPDPPRDISAPPRTRAVASPEVPVTKPRDISALRSTSSPPLAEAPPEPPAPVIERSTLLKGYEYEKGKFVLFTADELKALEAGSRKTIDISSFVPLSQVDPIYYDKAYYLAPDKHGSKPYSLLLGAMQETERCGLAKWAFRSKEYVAQIRPAEGGIVLQQLLYADEVRSFKDLRIECTAVGEAELALAKQLIEQISVDAYDPKEFVDEEKQRILAAVSEKLAGRPLPLSEQAASRGGQVVDLVQALRASLEAKSARHAGSKASIPSVRGRKPPKRASPAAAVSAAPKARGGKRERA